MLSIADNDLGCHIRLSIEGVGYVALVMRLLYKLLHRVDVGTIGRDHGLQRNLCNACRGRVTWHESGR